MLRPTGIFVLNNRHFSAMWHKLAPIALLIAVCSKTAFSCTSTAPRPSEIPPNSRIVSCTPATVGSGSALCNLTCNAGYQQQGDGLFVCLFNTWYSENLFACLSSSVLCFQSEFDRSPLRHALQSDPRHSMRYHGDHGNLQRSVWAVAMQYDANLPDRVSDVVVVVVLI